MLPSFVSNLFWGDEQQNTANQQALTEPELVHTVCEEQDEWMVIECNETGMRIMSMRDRLVIIYLVHSNVNCFYSVQLE